MDPTAEPTNGESSGAGPSEPEHVTPQAAAPEPAAPEPATPEPAAPEPTDPQAAAPEPAAPEPTDPQAAAPEPADPHADAPEPADATQVAAPEVPWPPVPGGAQFATPTGQVPPHGAIPSDPQPGSAQAPPRLRSALEQHRTLTVLASIGVAILIGALAIVVTALTGPANSTLSLRLIVPAPTSAGGFARDYADESSVQLATYLTQFRHGYAAQFHRQVSSSVGAIYTNATVGQPGSSGSVVVLYAGLNLSGEPQDPASVIRKDILKPGTHSGSVVQVPGLPGDTTAECVGSVPAANGPSSAVCVWATDKTISVVISLKPTTTTQLASVLKKIWPDLVRS